MANAIWSSGIANAPTVEMIVTQQSQNIAENYSVLAWSLVLHRPYSVSSSASKSYNAKINGVTVSIGTTTIGGSGDKTIASGTTTVYHNSDGTKTGVPFSFYMDIGLTWSGSPTGNASGSGTINLTAIPRASTGSLSTTTPKFGDTITINIQRPTGTSFTHHVYEDFFAGQWTLITTDGKVATSTSWTIPLDYAKRIPNAKSGGCRILIETWDGSTFVGTSIINFSIGIADSMVPTVSIGTAAVDAYSGRYVQNRSKVAVTLTSDGSYDSTIVSQFTSVRFGDNIISTSSAASFTSSVLTYAGTITIATTVTDSRGISKSASTTITVKAYEVPKITAFAAFRANSDGTPNDRGAYIRITGTAAITSIDGVNPKTTILRYRIKGETTWTNATTNTTSYTPSLAATPAANANNSFEVQIFVDDSISTTAQTINVGTAFTLLNFTADGKSMAIGKVAEGKAMLELFGDMLIQNIGQDTKLLIEQLTGNAGIEVGSPTLAATTYVDFRTSGNNNDYDARIYGSGGGTQNYQGLLGLRAGIIDLDAPTIRFMSNPKVNGHGIWNDGIIERGQNTSGKYIKFPDGTMVAFNRVVNNGMAITSAWGSWFITSALSYTFPATFYDNPVVAVHMENASGDIATWMNSTVSTTGFSGRFASGQSVTVNAIVGWIAIGRWK